MSSKSARAPRADLELDLLGRPEIIYFFQIGSLRTLSALERKRTVQIEKIVKKIKKTEGNVHGRITEEKVKKLKKEEKEKKERRKLWGISISNQSKR